MSEERKRTQVADVDRSLYDFTKSEEGYERYADGLTPDIVRAISAKKDEPEWMLQMRLDALDKYHARPMADNWGPSIAGLDLDHISTYVSPKTKQAKSWDDVPADIKDTFDRLGIPAAERESLAGVGAQYDSEIVYHNMREDVAKQGVVYTTIEDALHDPKWEPVVHEYFGTLIPPTDHKFAALHYAVWSGGSFVYVPAGVTLDYPLQSYFRLNAQGAGQFEHTLIIVEPGADLHFIEGCSAPKYNEANLHAGAVELFVGKDGARLRYSTIENWSKNMYNLNTKRATVRRGRSKIEWVSGSFGSHVGYLYPISILAGRKLHAARSPASRSPARAQNLDTGCKVVHGRARDVGALSRRSPSPRAAASSTFRSSVVVAPPTAEPRALQRVVPVASCSTTISRSDTIPAMDIRCNATWTGRATRPPSAASGDDKVFYLMSRGMFGRGGAHHDGERLRRPRLQGTAPWSTPWR